MRLAGPRRFLVTLGGRDRVDSDDRAGRDDLRPSALHTGIRCRATSVCRRSNDDRIVFAGAYHGWGFHEDGAASGSAGGRATRRRRGRAAIGDGRLCRADTCPLPDPHHASAPRSGAPLLRTPQLQLVRRHRPAAASCRAGCGRSPDSRPPTTFDGAARTTHCGNASTTSSPTTASTCAAAPSPRCCRLGCSATCSTR